MASCYNKEQVKQLVKGDLFILSDTYGDFVYIFQSYDEVNNYLEVKDPKLKGTNLNFPLEYGMAIRHTGYQAVRTERREL